MTQNDRNIAGIILDSSHDDGQSGPIALQKINNISFLEAVAKPLKECNCSPLIIVSTENTRIADEARRLGVSLIFDDGLKKGEIAGLKKAMADFRNDLLGALVLPVTYPSITSNVYLLLCHVFMENPDRIIIPIYKGNRGYPVALPYSVIDEIIGNSKILYFDDLIRAHSDLIFEQLVNDPGISKQVRSAGDLKNL